VPLDRWQEGISLLAQADPSRGQQLGNLLTYVSHIQGAQQQIAAEQRQNLSKWVMAEDAKLEKMVGKQTNAEKAQFADDLVAYAGELGVSRADLIGAIEAQPVLRSAAMQKMMWDALQYRKIKSSPKPAATTALPPVQRPGTSNAIRATPESTKVHALESQLAGARGDKAVRIAAKLASMRRS